MKKVHVAKKASRSFPAFKLAPIALLLAGSPTAFAQASGASDGSAVVTVTGIRKAIEDAVSVKKGSDQIVEAISAEDIGKLPDASVAESISRLPGVTAQRNKSTGKAQGVSVRGMSPDFNGALLNGREQASTGDSRGVEFDQFPSELLGSVVIYKTPEAGLTGQGLASTIDMKTVRPLDFRKRTVAVNYREQTTGIDSGAGEGSGDRFSLSYVDQFADRKLGIALGYTKFKDSGAEQLKTNTWGGWSPEVDYNGQKVKVMGGFGGDTEQSTSDREGLMAVLQFKPNKNFESVIDFFSSEGKFGLKKTGLEGPIGGNSGGKYEPATKLWSNVTVANGVMTSGTLANFQGVVRNHIEGGNDELTSWGWNNKFKLGDWTAVADIAQSKVVRDSQRYETTAGTPGNSTSFGGLSWTGFNGSNHSDVKFTTGINYADRSVVKLTDVLGWSGGVTSPQAGYSALPHMTDQIDSLRLTGKRAVSLGPISAAEFGINYVEREKVRETVEGRLVIPGNNPYGTAEIPGSGSSIAGDWGIPVAKWDPRGSLGTIYDIVKKVDSDILNKDWAVEEKVTTAFAKGDLEGELFGLPYRGNVGVQVVGTDQGSRGYNVDRANCTGNTAATCPGAVVADGKTYSDINPSLNLNFDLSNDQVVRVGVAKVMSRPNMSDMRSSLGFSINNDGAQILSGSGGNPDLEPFRAWSYDVSYEKYFGSKGYVSVAGFYKDLDTYILTLGRLFDFAPFVSPTTPLPTTGPNAGSTIGILQQPFNGDGGTIKGIELALNIPFSMLTKYLDGFGVMFNHSNTSSSLSLPRTGFGTDSVDVPEIPLPGLSKKVTNTRLYYENYGFQIAVAQRKRSDFLGEISDFQDNRRLSFIKGETILDLQASYEFQSGWLKGLSVLFQGNNMNNAEFQRYNTDRNNPTEKVKYGKTYLMGVNYKF